MAENYSDACRAKRVESFLASFVVVCGRTCAGADLFSICLHFAWSIFFYMIYFFTKLFFSVSENQLDVNKFSGGKNEQFYTLNRLVAA